MIDIQAFKLGQDFKNLRVLTGEYSFAVFGLKTVRVKIWFCAVPDDDDHYCFTQSHFFPGAGQQGTEIPAAAYAATEESALRKAMMTFVTLFPPEKPLEESDQNLWLVENKEF